MDLCHIFYQFVMLSILGIIASMFYIWIKDLHMRKCINAIPGIHRNTIASYFMMLKNIYSNRRMLPVSILIVQLCCALCHVYDKERIFRMWMLFWPIVFLYKPETVEVLLSSNSNIDKSKQYNILGKGLLASTGDKWRKRRKLLTPSFHYRILEDFIPIHNEKSQVFVEKLKRLADEDWVDITLLSKLCALDIICETTMGVRINALATDHKEFLKAIEEGGDAFMFRALRPWLWSDITFYLTSCGRQFKRNRNIVHSFTRKVMKEKKEMILRKQKESRLQKDGSHEQENRFLKRHPKALLEFLLELHINDNTLSEEDIREEVDTFIIAGYETTAAAISWALYNIGLRPDVQEKIHMELESIFGGDSERPVTSDDLKAMKYLDCVLKESLRLYPSVPFIARELREDIQVLNYTVPKGTTCIITPYVLHRDPKEYPNPEVFDPDRFLPENSGGRHPYAYIPFSAGPRNCIGKKFAVMEEKIFVSSILRNFILKSLDERDKVKVSMNMILSNVDPLRIKLIPRHH